MAGCCFLKEYASYIKDSMINELTSLNRSLMLSIDIIPVPPMRRCGRCRTACWGGDQCDQLAAPAEQQQQLLRRCPYDLEQQRKETARCWTISPPATSG